MSQKQASIFYLFLGCLCISSFTVLAESFPIAGFDLSPNLNVQEKYDTNILSSESNVKSAFVTVVSPSIYLNAHRSNSQYALSYRANAADYLNNQTDDYLDQRLQANLKLFFSRQSQINTKAKYLKLHQDRGTGFSQGFGSRITQPDEYNVKQISTLFTYGTNKSTGRIEIGISGFAQRYENRDEIVKLSNRNHINSHAIFYYRVRPKTSLLFELKNTEVDYRIESSTPSLDNTEQRLLLGGTWDITSITKGIVKFGMLRKEFRSGERNTFTGISWNIEAHWRPLTYSKFNIKTSRKTEETLGTGDYIESKAAAIIWRHTWHKQIGTRTSATIRKNKFRPTTHAEGIWSLGFHFTYKMRRWLEIGTGITHIERLSTQFGLDYQRNILMLEISLNT